MKSIKEFINENWEVCDKFALKNDLKKWWDEYVDSLHSEGIIEYKNTLKNIADGKDKLIHQATQDLHTDYHWSHQDIETYKNDIIEILKNMANDKLLKIH